MTQSTQRRRLAIFITTTPQKYLSSSFSNLRLSLSLSLLWISFTYPSAISGMENLIEYSVIIDLGQHKPDEKAIKSCSMNMISRESERVSEWVGGRVIMNMKISLPLYAWCEYLMRISSALQSMLPILVTNSFFSSHPQSLCRGGGGGK